MIRWRWISCLWLVKKFGWLIFKDESVYEILESTANFTYVKAHYFSSLFTYACTHAHIATCVFHSEQLSYSKRIRKFHARKRTFIVQK